MDKEITVHVRSPSLNETLNVEISLNATVISLKKSIESVHPSHPSASNQRIIFSGKLLQDTDTLNDVLKKVEDGVIPTFHLVVKPSLQAFQKQTASTSQQQQPAVATAIPSSSTTIPPPLQPEAQQQQQQQPMQNNIPGFPPLLPGGYQVVFINGQYYLAPVLTPSQPFSLPQAQQPQPQNILQQFILPQQQQQQQQQQQPPRQPFFGLNQFVDRQVNNVQRAASVWLALKLIVILFMLCQGASIERIFIFHTIAFVFFLYQTGRLRVVFRRVRVQDLNRPVNPPAPPQQQAEPTPNATESTQQQQPEQRPARPPTTLDVVKRGIYAFFASLWPSYGVDPRIAQAFENENNNNNNE